MLKSPLGILSLLFLAFQIGLPAHALPTGWEVISGQVGFSQSGNTLTVTSSSQQAIVQYISFNLASGETVNFVLPGASASILNRVTGNGASLIAGNINSNGQFGLINRAGIQVTNTAQLQAAGLLLSTLNLSDQSYLSKTYALTEGDSAGIIQNNGWIGAETKGSVTLAGNQVNNSGVIFAPDGQINLAVGDRITLYLSNSTEIEVTVDEGIHQQINSLNAAINNTGAISAKHVALQAKLNNQLISSAINNEGLIEANSISQDGGTIKIYGASSNGGTAVVGNTGLISASDKHQAGVISIRGDINYNSGALVANSQASGGYIEQLGQTVINEGALIDVSGKTGGGYGPDWRRFSGPWNHGNRALQHGR